MIILSFISSFSILLPGGMVCFTWNRQKLAIKLVSIFILFSLCFEIIGVCLFLQGINNRPFFHIFTWVENILLGLYFIQLYGNRVARLIVAAIMILFFVFWLADLIYHPRDFIIALPRETRLVECVIMMIFCIYFYIELFLSSETVNLMRYPHYWLVSGFFLYFAGTFFLNLVGDMAIDSAQLGFYGYDIHSVLNIFLNLIFTLTLWIGRKASISARS